MIYAAELAYNSFRSIVAGEGEEKVGVVRSSITIDNFHDGSVMYRGRLCSGYSSAYL